MYNIIRFSAASLTLVFLLSSRLPLITKNSETDRKYSAGELISLIEDTRVEGQILETSVLRAGMSDSSAVVVLVPAGSRVEILRDHSGMWYLVRDIGTDKQGWVKRGVLDIPQDDPTDTSDVNRAQLEGFVNAMGYDSATKFLVIVDINRQQTHVFKGTKRKWTLLRTMTVSTGKNESPTVRGEFKLKDRGLWFYSDRLGSGGRFWVRFDGPYLFHSVAMDRSGNVIDDTLGKKSSNGCVRLSVPDAEWFYKTVPDKTKVVIK